MTLPRSFLSALVGAMLSVSAAATAAHAELWLCQVEQLRSNDGWIPSTVALGFENGSDVFVGFVIHDGTYQTEGTVSRQNGERVTVRVPIRTMTQQGRPITLNYRAELDRGAQAIRVMMRADQYVEQRYSAAGTCAMQES